VAYKLCSEISVELTDSCHAQACGPDGLSAEHLLYARPSLVVHLKLLFNLLFLQGFVPGGFDAGVIVPLIKDKSGNLNDIHYLRPISLLLSQFFNVLENVVFTARFHA